MVFLDIANDLIDTEIFSDTANSIISVGLFLDSVYFLRYSLCYIFCLNNTKLHHTWIPLNEEQCSVKSIYSMMMHQETSRHLYAIAQAKLLQGNCGEERERENERERRKSERQCVAKKRVWHRS